MQKYLSPQRLRFETTASLEPDRVDTSEPGYRPRRVPSSRSRKQWRLGAAPSGIVTADAFDLILQSPRLQKALAPRLILQVGAPPTSSAYEAFLLEQRPRRIILGAQGWEDPQSSAEVLVQGDLDAIVEDLLPRLQATQMGAKYTAPQESAHGASEPYEAPGDGSGMVLPVSLSPSWAMTDPSPPVARPDPGHRLPKRCTKGPLWRRAEALCWEAIDATLAADQDGEAAAVRVVDLAQDRHGVHPG